MVRPPEFVRESSTATSSSSSSPERTAYEDDTDFFNLVRNDSESSLGALSLREDPTSPTQDDLDRLYRLCPISRLPPELLIGIFARLNSSGDLRNCMLVSKNWAKHSAEILWHRPQCNTASNLESVRKSILNQNAFFPYHNLIRRLNLSSLSEMITDEILEAFGACKRIERLTLTGCKSLTDAGISKVMHGSRGLLALDITGLDAITDETILAIGGNCNRLQGLNISDCSKVTDIGLKDIAENCHFLKRLKLNNCFLIGDRSVLAVAKNCSSMLEIDLYQCRLVSNTSVTNLVRQGKFLRELRVGYCHLLTDRAFLDLPTKTVYESLRILDLTACHNLRDEAVERIVTSFPRLRNLVLAKCRDITDRSVLAITKLGKNLHYIHLGHCINITDTAVVQLVKSCNRIRYIDLACCQRLTDVSVRMLAMLPKLRRIGLVKCQSITDRSILALARAYPDQRQKAMMPSLLERVHLSYCVHLTLQGIHALLNQCPRLTHLSLTGVQAFFGEGNLTAFCREAPPEFTEHQRTVFCVFSGEGVNRLRSYLNQAPVATYRTGATIAGVPENNTDMDNEEHVNALMNAAGIHDDDDDEIIDAEVGEESIYGGEG